MNEKVDCNLCKDIIRQIMEGNEKRGSAIREIEELTERRVCLDSFNCLPLQKMYENNNNRRNLTK